MKHQLQLGTLNAQTLSINFAEVVALMQRRSIDTLRLQEVGAHNANVTKHGCVPYQ